MYVLPGQRAQRKGVARSGRHGRGRAVTVTATLRSGSHDGLSSHAEDHDGAGAGDWHIHCRRISLVRSRFVRVLCPLPSHLLLVLAECQAQRRLKALPSCPWDPVLTWALKGVPTTCATHPLHNTVPTTCATHPLHNTVLHCGTMNPLYGGVFSLLRLRTSDQLAPPSVDLVQDGQSITKYKSKWRNIWIQDVFCSWDHHL